MIITIGRQYGSGGRYIAKMVADQLNYAFFDDELLKLACQKAGFSEEMIRQFDEKPGNSLLYSTFVNSAVTTDNLPLNQKLAMAQFEIIEQLARSGNCVIVGRCADYILRNHPDLVTVFIHAPGEFRAARLEAYYGVPRQLTDKTMKKHDRKRADYYNFFTQKKWGASQSYHLCLDSSVLGVEGTAEAIVAYARLRERLN
ncbi:MAG: cytidylate kinase-like family protein [Oscillospiraceae bacterium]|nr:cytidylate kinase-like family protein [Oscillospiraceae bacterium]